MPEAQTTEVRARRRRPSRRSIYYCKVTFIKRVKEDQFEEELRVKEVSLNDDALKDNMDHTVKLFLDKKLEPFRINPHTERDEKGKLIKRGADLTEAASLQHKEQSSTVDEKGVRRYTTRPVPVTFKHILAIKYYETDEDGWEEDDDGPIKPWVHVVFHDGSQADLLLKTKRRSKKRTRR